MDKKLYEYKVLEHPEFGKIRVFEFEGENWFVGRDIVKALGYNSTSSTMRTCCKRIKRFPMKKLSDPNSTQFREIFNMKCFAQSDLHCLIDHSKFPKKKEFEDWIFSELSTNDLADQHENDQQDHSLQIKRIPIIADDSLEISSDLIEQVSVDQSQHLELKIFENPEFGKIRALEINGEIWFVGIDVARALGYKNGYRDVVRHVDEEDRKTISREEFQKYRNGSFEISNRGLTVVNESGFYSLVMGSKLPRAKEFTHWVTSEVLPSIRKHGMFVTDNLAETILQDPSYFIKVLNEYRKEQEKRKKAEETIKIQNIQITEQKAQIQTQANVISVQKNQITEQAHKLNDQKDQIEELSPKAKFFDDFIRSDGVITSTIVGSFVGMSAKQLNLWAHKKGLIFKRSNYWEAYIDFRRLHYFTHVPITIIKHDGTKLEFYPARWTKLGLVWALNLLEEEGYKLHLPDDPDQPLPEEIMDFIKNFTPQKKRKK